MKQQWFKAGIYSLACIPAALILLDLGRATIKNQPVPPSVLMAQVPKDILNPASAHVALDAAGLRRYTAQKPSRSGDPVPTMKTIDFRNEEMVIPATDGKPTVWVVSCGCVECGGVVHELVRLREAYGEQFHAAAIVATRSHYVWGHHGGSFGSKPIQVARDEAGSLAFRLRPPGPNPTQLPIVWCCDGQGILRYTGRPLGDPTWKARITRQLNLKKPPIRVRAL